MSLEIESILNEIEERRKEKEKKVEEVSNTSIQS
jgi:hypothetical protein